MYFPYFRGRQYELLALKELANKKLLGKHVIPVVEPIKITSTLNGALSAFQAAQSPIALIFNPAVGDLSVNHSAVSPLYKHIGSTSIIVPSLLLNKTASETYGALSFKGVTEGDILAVLNDRDFIQDYKDMFLSQSPKFTLSPDERGIRRAINGNKVLFEDKFKKQPRNADYPADEFFSEDHLFFVEEGYFGFGDYSIIGDEYIESGFAPYAVAIHIVYFSNDNSLRVRHFISDSNDDTSDVAGKFHEAVTKLTSWYNQGQERQLTNALSTLLEHSKTGYYPGLPTIKKLSIMHHLELMERFLSGAI
jgi:hypothetical protein